MLTTVKVHYDGKAFIPEQPVNLPVNAVAKVVYEERSPQPAQRQLGWLKGHARISADFYEKLPLDFLLGEKP